MAVTIKLPMAGNVAHLAIDARATDVQFAFPENDASYSRDGANLVITATDGGVLILENFFQAHASGKLPTLVMEDGTPISSENFLTAFDSEFDISPAMGPGSQSNGLNAYNDGSGSLIGGIERLSDQGSPQWDAAFSPTITSTAITTPLASPDNNPAFVTPTPQPPASDNNPSGTTPVPEQPSLPEYSARAVLYKTDAGAGDNVSFRLLDSNHNVVNPANVQFTITDQNGYFLLPASVNADGTLSLTLSPAGLQALQENPSANVYEYFSVTVDGHSYSMQVVVNQDGSFDSHAEDQLTNGGNTSGYEWHTEQDGTGQGQRDASHGDNEVWLTSQNAGDVTFSGNFTSFEGQDTITIVSAGTGLQSAFIDTGSGHDSLTITATDYGMYSSAANDGNIVKNANDVHVTGAYAMYATGSGAENSIRNADEVHLQGTWVGVYSAAGANNLVEAQGVTIDASAVGSMTAGIMVTGVGSATTINAGQDGIQISAIGTPYINYNSFYSSKALYAADNGHIELSTQNGGDITLLAQSLNKQDAYAIRADTPRAQAEDTTTVTLDSSHDIILQSSNDTGGAYGLYAASSSNINGVYVPDVSLKAAHDIKVFTQAGTTTTAFSGAMTIDAGHDVYVEVTGDTGAKAFSGTQSGGGLVVNAHSGDITAKVAGGSAMGGQDLVTLTAAHNINITADATKTYATGFGSANAIAENTLTAGDGIMMKVTSTGGTTADGLKSTGYGKIVLQANTVDLDVQGKLATMGLNIDNPNAKPTAPRGYINVHADTTDITAHSTLGNAYALGAMGYGDILIDGKVAGNASAITLDATADAGEAYGISATKSGSTTLKATDLTVHASGASSSMGMSALNDAATNTVEASGLVNISADSSQGNAYGVYSGRSGTSTVGGQTTISAHHLQIHAEASAEGLAYPSSFGVYSQGAGSAVTLNVSGENASLNITSTASGGAASGVTAATAYGILAYGDAGTGVAPTILNINMTDANNHLLNISATSQLTASDSRQAGNMAMAIAVAADRSSEVHINAGSGNDTLNLNAKVITEHGAARSTGLSVFGSMANGSFTPNSSFVTLNTGEGDDLLNINAIAGTTDTQFYANASATGISNNGILTIDGGEGHDTLKINAHADAASGKVQAYGIVGGGQTTITNIEDINISLTTNTQQANGMNPTTGLSAGVTITDVENVRLNFSDGWQNTLGMSAFQTQNRIESAADHPITVIFHGCGSNPTSYAMSASAGGSNSIIGHSKAGTSDLISLDGGIYTGNSASSNIIHTGEGNDVIHMNGPIYHANNLPWPDLNAGSGFDTLILEAPSLKDFQSYYKEWLTTIESKGGFSNLNIDSIQVVGADQGQLPWLEQIANNHGVELHYYDQYVDAFDLHAGFSATTGEDYLVSITGHDVQQGDHLTLQDGKDALHLTGALNGGHFDMGAGDDHVYLNGASLTNVTLQGGLGMDTLHIDGISKFSLSDMVSNGNAINGFEVLDMSGSQANELTLDNISGLFNKLGIDTTLDASKLSGGDASLMNSLIAGNNTLIVNGDSNDTVKLTDGWEQAGAVHYDGTAYQVYHNDNNDYVLVQQVVSITG